jgi:hypothetical protein
MANNRKTKILRRELGELDRQGKDYMENLANSLLEIQNTALTSNDHWTGAIFEEIDLSKAHHEP